MIIRRLRSRNLWFTSCHGYVIFANSIGELMKLYAERERDHG